jgi:Lsr2
MAQKVQTLFIDDIDGGEADGTIRFGLDGSEYEIDLSAKHSEELRSALGKYVSHSRRLGGTARRGARTAGRTGRAAGPAVNTTEIRNWARENGYDIKDRGRVPADVVAKYQAAMGT